MSLYKRFKKLLGYKLNVEDPKTFNEKMQWIKLNGQTEMLSKYVDKYEVRQFIKETIGSKYLIPIIGIYQCMDDLDIESLPDSFVMKVTHGSGMNVLVPDKKSLDWVVASRRMKKWLAMNYYLVSGEPCYKPLKGRVLVESFIKDLSNGLKDYKFFCFHGKPTYVQVVSHKWQERRSNMYDLNWIKLDFEYANKEIVETVQKPKQLDEMIQIASKLAKDFPFVRVDLYQTNKQIYFGELTFFPNSGLKRFIPIEYDRVFGDQVDLSKYELPKATYEE